jgi:hypothetical protein
MSVIKGSLRADSVIANPEIIRNLTQRSIIIFARSRNEIGIAINLFLEKHWYVNQCWASPHGNHHVLLMKE